jgi:hypothetical protein
MSTFRGYRSCKTSPFIGARGTTWPESLNAICFLLDDHRKRHARPVTKVLESLLVSSIIVHAANATGSPFSLRLSFSEFQQIPLSHVCTIAHGPICCSLCLLGISRHWNSGKYPHEEVGRRRWAWDRSGPGTSKTSRTSRTGRTGGPSA